MPTVIRRSRPACASIDLADHRDGRRRDESLRSRSGCAPRRLAPGPGPARLAAACGVRVVDSVSRLPRWIVVSGEATSDVTLDRSKAASAGGQRAAHGAARSQNIRPEPPLFHATVGGSLGRRNHPSLSGRGFLGGSHRSRWARSWPTWRRRLARATLRPSPARGPRRPGMVHAESRARQRCR